MRQFLSHNFPFCAVGGVLSRKRIPPTAREFIQKRNAALWQRSFRFEKFLFYRLFS